MGEVGMRKNRVVEEVKEMEMENVKEVKEMEMENVKEVKEVKEMEMEKGNVAVALMWEDIMEKLRGMKWDNEKINEIRSYVKGLKLE